MRPLHVPARADAAGWLIEASGGFLPRMALGRRMRLVLLVVSSHRHRLVLVSWLPGVGV